MKKIDVNEHIFYIENFLTPQECDDYLIWSEQKGYEDAKVQIDGKQVDFKSIRNNQRITFIDIPLAEKIWTRLEPFVQKTFGNSSAIGLNELFRFYKYENGQRFKKHIDGSYVRNEQEASQFTLLIYLNDDFEGGETTFETMSVKPSTGMALIFYHGIKHAGEPVAAGVKYVLRTDIMFRITG